LVEPLRASLAGEKPSGEGGGDCACSAGDPVEQVRAPGGGRWQWVSGGA